MGIVGASVTALAIIALPQMINRGYSKSQWRRLCRRHPGHPHSAQHHAGSLRADGVTFGRQTVLCRLFTRLHAFRDVLYLYCHSQSYQAGNSPTRAGCRKGSTLAEENDDLVTSLVPPAVLIMAVLGSIFFGIAAPTEAAAVGALAATLLAVAYRKFSFSILKDTATETVKVTGMVLLIGATAYAFVGIFMRAGGGDIVENLILSAPGGKWGIFAIVMFIVFLLGYFIDWLGILFIIVPIITPVGEVLGFDKLWFAMMICVNLQTSFLTPPFAYSISISAGRLTLSWE